jgi:DNA-binding transcriptional ArsR family regulator
MAVTDDELTLVFTALADPTRRAILARLAQGEATVNQLAEPFAMSQQAVSKHLKVLERARLISRGRAAQARPCALEADRLAGAVDWIEDSRRTWAERHDRLARHLESLTGPAVPPPPETPATPATPRATRAPRTPRTPRGRAR